MDLNKSPYAPWLEGMVQEIINQQPASMALVMRCKDNNILTAYYKCTMEEKAHFASQIQMDVIMDTVLINADRIVDQAKEMEDEEDGEF